MVADFVDEHVGDEMAEGFLVLRPIIQKRPAIKPHHVGELARSA